MMMELFSPVTWLKMLAWAMLGFLLLTFISVMSIGDKAALLEQEREEDLRRIHCLQKYKYDTKYAPEKCWPYLRAARYY